MSVKQFATLFQVSTVGVIKNIKKGEIHAIRISPGGPYRIPSTEVFRILNGNA